MTQLEKQKEMIDWLDENMFNINSRLGKEIKNKQIINGTNLTRGRMLQLPPEKMILFVYSAINGTNKSVRFYGILRENNAVTFEDVFDEFKEKFNNEWLNS